MDDLDKLDSLFESFFSQPEIKYDKPKPKPKPKAVPKKTPKDKHTITITDDGAIKDITVSIPVNNPAIEHKPEHRDIYNTFISKFNPFEYSPGHYTTTGQKAYKYNNPIWKIKENDKTYLLMYCEKDTICKLCPDSYNKIIEFEQKNNNNKKLTWYKTENGYIQTYTSLSASHKSYYIHQVITGCHGNGKGTKNISVDHIDRDPLNNTMENLRVASLEVQQQNSKGIMPDTLRERSSNKMLPDGIEYNMLKKYVYYNEEYYDKEKLKKRCYFRVEHPRLHKPWSSSKSMNVSVLDKLKSANTVSENLDKGIYPEQPEAKTPLYVSLTNARGKPHLVYERYINDIRQNVKMVLPENYELQNQVMVLNERIIKKYGIAYSVS